MQVVGWGELPDHVVARAAVPPAGDLLRIVAAVLGVPIVLAVTARQRARA